MKLLSTSELKALLGSDGTIIRTMRSGNKLICSYPSNKSGRPNQFTIDDVVQNIITIQLMKLGMNLPKAHTIASDVDISVKKAKVIVWAISIMIDIDKIRESIDDFLLTGKPVLK